ncbi:T9SS type A sorting domain-containing protein [Dyadobacter psychrophilus]|uniref:Por secretion system C-terminal sorting domain-containing protein n=1 Tax=Dyadobacter psychrophilus TaxID=651661 RepID=A0A1T5CP04_9BACT|nr:T9SS type A sorting domain-containing protein [Dyadobacter psychrophilus]SKB61071.1 Por secretion system C-terminal sorting domain-containing protein [Dyadobacter psychrophilus]
MKKISLVVLTLYAICALQVQAQEKVIRSEYGLTIYPVKKIVNNIAVFPNPAAANISFKSTHPAVGYNVEIFDKKGRSCMKREHWDGEELDISKLQTGTYIVRFTRGREEYSRELVVQL